MSEPRDNFKAWLVASRAAQGLPPKVANAEKLAAIATILRGGAA